MTESSKQLKALLQHCIDYIDELGQEREVSNYTELEGCLWVTELLSSVTEQFLHADPLRPLFQVYNTPFRRILGDQIDNLANYVARISASESYHVRFEPGDAVFYSLSVYGGEDEGKFSTYIVGKLNQDEMQRNADGSIDIYLGGEQRSGNWIALDDTTMSICTREYFYSDYLTRQPGRWTIERLGESPAPPRLNDKDLAEKLRLALLNIEVNTGMSPLPQASGLFTTQTGVNEFAPLKRLTTNVAIGWSNADAVHATLGYQLAADQAIVIEGQASPPVAWWGLNQNNEYMQSFNGLSENVAITGHEIVHNEDGSWRVVLAHEDPGCDNWLSTAGRSHGFLRIRWLVAESDPEPPTATVASLADVRSGKF